MKFILQDFWYEFKMLNAEKSESSEDDPQIKFGVNAETF